MNFLKKQGKKDIDNSIDEPIQKKNINTEANLREIEKEKERDKKLYEFFGKIQHLKKRSSLNQEKLKTYYPFISDAPTSNFDPSTTHKYLLGIKDVFHQSIIMTKDVVIGSDNYNDLFNQDKVSRIYELTSHIYNDGDNEPEIYEVSTNVERLK